MSEISVSRIVDLSQDGRGVARLEMDGAAAKKSAKASNPAAGKRPRTRLGTRLGRSASQQRTGKAVGKTCFISGALPGELVRWQRTQTRGSYDEGHVVEVIEPSTDRVTPHCKHFDDCGGCALQHLAIASQPSLKQTHLQALLQRAGIQPGHWLPPLISAPWGYRCRARLQVSFNKSVLALGFHQQSSNNIVDIDECSILDPRLASKLLPLRDGLQRAGAFLKRHRLIEVELLASDNGCALCLRFKTDLNVVRDVSALSAVEAFCRQHEWQCWVAKEQQPPERWFGESSMYVELEDDVKIQISPGQFVQVNAAVNRKMIAQSLQLLELESTHRVLDLFAGAGNFSLPMAKRAKHVCGVEGAEPLCQQGRENAQLNSITNTDFRVADLSKPDLLQHFLKNKIQFERILIDPPRTGAQALIPDLAALRAEKLLYISCHPAALVRDAHGLLEAGYNMASIGILDMFPHTEHLEAMALFELR